MRERIIRPEFVTDSTMMKLSLEERYCFIMLWFACDDYGVFEYDEDMLKYKIIPMDKDIDMRSVLKSLEKHGRIKIFMHDGKRYGYVPTLLRHQTYRYKRKTHMPMAPADLLREDVKAIINIQKMQKEISKNSAKKKNVSKSFTNVQREDIEIESEIEIEADTDRRSKKEPTAARGSSSALVLQERPEHSRFVDEYFRLYDKDHPGRKPNFTATQGAAVKRMLKKHGYQECLERLEFMYSDECPQFILKSGRDLRQWEAHWDKLARSYGSGSQITPGILRELTEYLEEQEVQS